MSEETKRDVFVNLAKKDRDNSLFDSERMETSDEVEKEYRENIHDYDAALPDDLPVIPKAVGEYIQERKAAHESLAFALTARWVPKEVIDWMCMVAGDSDTELSQIEYVKQQDIFARAWVLGAWRVEESGEIVKLEAEK